MQAVEPLIGSLLSVGATTSIYIVVLTFVFARYEAYDSSATPGASVYFWSGSILLVAFVGSAISTLGMLGMEVGWLSYGRWPAYWLGGSLLVLVIRGTGLGTAVVASDWWIISQSCDLRGVAGGGTSVTPTAMGRAVPTAPEPARCDWRHDCAHRCSTTIRTRRYHPQSRDRIRGDNRGSWGHRVAGMQSRKRRVGILILLGVSSGGLVVAPIGSSFNTYLPGYLFAGSMGVTLGYATR